jgi:hypothetical protein
MQPNSTIEIYSGYSGTTKVMKVELQNISNGTYRLRIGLLNAGAAWKYSAWYTISGDWSGIEIAYYAGSNANGWMKLWINGELKETLSGVTNNTYTIDSVRMGAMNNTSTVNDTMYFDDYVSTRLSYIGSGLCTPERFLREGHPRRPRQRGRQSHPRGW